MDDHNNFMNHTYIEFSIATLNIETFRNLQSLFLTTLQPENSKVHKAAIGGKFKHRLLQLGKYGSR